MRIGIATDHGGFSLKEELLSQFREGDDIVGIVVALIQSVSAEIDDLVSRSAELFDQLFL